MSTYWHLCCYSGSVPNTGANNDVAFVTDSVLTKSNNHAILPQDGQLIAAAVIGESLNRVRLNTPAARYVSLPSVVPPIVGTTVPSNPNIANFDDGPLTIPKADEVAFEFTQAGAGAEVQKAGVIFSFGKRPVPSGQKYRIRGTAAITGSTSAWVNGAITLDSTLPRGMYAVVGLQVVATNIFLGRLVFPGASYRPGCLGQESAGLMPAPIFTDGTLGVFGEFDSVNTPALDIICLGACNAQTVYMDIIKIS